MGLGSDYAGVDMGCLSMITCNIPFMRLLNGI